MRTILRPKRSESPPNSGRTTMSVSWYVANTAVTRKGVRSHC